MKILMFGRGVISILYGRALEQAGHSVHYYVRPGRKQQLGKDVELDIYDLRQPRNRQKIQEILPTHLIEELPRDHDYDLIFVSVQHYHFDEVATFLAPRVGSATVLIFNNFWKDPREAASGLPHNQLAWGFPAAGGGFTDGILHGALFPKIEFGTFEGEPTERQRAVRKMFEEAGFIVKEHRRFHHWLWVHFAVNAAIVAQVFRAGSMRKVMGNAAQAREAILNIREIMPVLVARGVPIDDHPELKLFNKPAWLVAMLLGLTLRFSAGFRATVDGHANVEELRRFLFDLLEESRRLGIKLPRIEAIRDSRADLRQDEPQA